MRPRVRQRYTAKDVRRTQSSHALCVAGTPRGSNPKRYILDITYYVLIQLSQPEPHFQASAHANRQSLFSLFTPTVSFIFYARSNADLG